MSDAPIVTISPDDPTRLDLHCGPALVSALAKRATPLHVGVFWFAEVSTAAPDVPAWHRAMTAKMLADPATNSDMLLLLADAFTEAALYAAHVQGDGRLAIQLHKLAEVPRRLAPIRAAEAG